MLFLALSCLQGRPQLAAATSLLALEPDGLQLTQGSHPSLGFRAWLQERPRLALRVHDGYSFSRVRTHPSEAPESVLGGAALPQSLHPPSCDAGIALDAWLAAIGERGQIAETMYPGHLLGCGEELEEAMAAGADLAVDISHLYIQRERGVLSPRTEARLFDYDRIAEIHVSANDGRADQHRPLSQTSYGLSWARARLQLGCAVILESYFHRLSEPERRHQLDLLRECH